MPKYTVQVIQTNEFIVEVEAEDESKAIEFCQDLDSDEIMEYETDARWDYLVVGETNA